ncbi:conserved hypothetical protein [Aspergillus terreus NIH2624]|uniref:Calcium channel YVC1-like C-terminal transmembrane domain-containing protein n=1 Tax=Aspergillus terreus (strain NIH 2624 / FGSC A1156) TaxID=341663 RepID=Q0CMP3_ASPTN|nr:uncharacterized protein ATEG_05041 [Aspergillus terreus NIH2624]EAU34110.1 conserved hypothetical protein [Aspergillus terreus NIH2624]
MLASLLRPKKRRVYAERSPFSSPYTTRESAWPILQRNSGPGYHQIQDHPADDHGIEHTEYDDEDADGEDGEDEEDGPIESTPLLPIFSASHLDTLPVYDITHAIRPLIVSRCETTLTWDQLRSPQISQFLVKPIQQKIRAFHFSRATLYALLTNCLQFNREVHLNPGNSGVNQTRAMVSELLAMKLLREYTTQGIDYALCTNSIPGRANPVPGTGSCWQPTPGTKRFAGVARISCLEIAIRTPGPSGFCLTLLLYSSWRQSGRAPSSFIRPPITSTALHLNRPIGMFLSTLSFAVLLALFLAVLQRRHVEITSLEIVFWFWSTGFMLDEIVGFNEQGFSLYLMSFWNLFDLGILFLLFCYYCMRLYGALMPITRTHAIANQAYDILAANAVLLVPRLFSVLDHYRYFSQLLIAFRIMASDLVAVFLLIIIACSGFFVAFTLSFGQGQDQSPGSVAFALFQMLMGFTPTAWTLWDEYNTLGKVILTIFLFICHFVVVTILITVLTNSFMGIVQNANQEHQFLFAVNTISMVKSDALFSYVAPTNILAWLITPLRYLMPFRQFVRVNRTIIKVTHLPILFTICLYEKTILSSKVVEPTDLVDPQAQRDMVSRPRPPRHSRFRAFTSNAPRLVREPSVATYQKDRALEEVFRQPFQSANRDRRRDAGTRESNNIVHNWMKTMGSGPVHPPDEQDSDEVSRLEKRSRRLRYSPRSRRTRSLRDFTASNRSAVSDPEEQVNPVASSPATPRPGRAFLTPTRTRQLSRHTGMEGDDELTSEDNDDWVEDQPSSDGDRKPTDKDWGKSPESPGKSTPKFYSSRPSTAKVKSRKTSPTRRPRYHTRNASAATMLYNPLSPASDGEASETTSIPIRPRATTPDHEGPANVSTAVDHWMLRRHSLDDSRSRNATIPRSNHMSVPDLGNFLTPDARYRERRQASILDALGSDLGDNRAIANGFLGGVPMSLTTQMEYATGGMRRQGSPSSSQDMLSKLVLARMNNIEEGFREVIREVKDLRREGTSRSQSRPDEHRDVQREKKRRIERKVQGSRKSKTSSEGRHSDDVSVEPHLIDV